MSDAGATVSNWNLPNLLTSLRIVMVPFFGYALLQDGGESVGWRLVAFALFVVAMITDKIDGDIARARNLVTDFGKIADPIADKAVTGMAFIGLAIVMDEWWMWVATIVVLVREWSVTLLRLSIMKNVVIAASRSGKIKTTLQAVALSLLCLPLLQVDGVLDRPGEVLYAISLVLLAGAVAMTLWSGYEFFRDAWRQRHAIRR
jgi:CDP-diacylglycerol--glycerol-3-phosphate 3-phosphatidyltransferase